MNYYYEFDIMGVADYYHLGNVLAVVSDKKFPVNDGNGNISYYLPDVISSMDYSPFGVLLEGRTFASESYRYGFNGMEKDDEVKGNGNSYTTEFRQYDPRLGRWLSIDPMFQKAPGWTPYRFGFNNPVRMIDPNGDYEADGSLSKKETKSIKKEHKNSGEKDWKNNANKEIKQKVAENIAKIEDYVSKAQNLLEKDDIRLEAFEKLTGTSKGGSKYKDFFENNGSGPKVKIQDLDNSGETDMFGNVSISSKGLTEYDVTLTILHEYIHAASNLGYIDGDYTSNGYKNLIIGGDHFTTAMQRSALDIARDKAGPENSNDFINVYRDLFKGNKSKGVEGGYLFEVIGFGTVKHPGN